MEETLSRAELEQRLVVLEEQLQQQSRSAAINQTLFNIASAINETADLDELFASIHRALGLIIDATNFYLALYDPSDDSITFPYIVDTVDTGYPRVIEVSKTASLTAEVIRTRAPLLVTKAEILARQAASIFPVPACTPAEIWLGVPLKTQNGIVGVMAVQHYRTADRYDQTDLSVLAAVADQVAVAIERKQLEKALRESEERIHLLVKNASDSLVVIDADHRQRYVSPGAERISGFSIDELTGKALQELIHPDDFEAVQTAWRNCVTHPEKTVTVQYRHIHKTKGWVYFEAVAQSFLDEPAVNAVIASVRDISERRQAEEVLRESEERYRLLSDLTMEGIALHKNGVVIDLNSSMATMLGYRREELFNKNFMDFIHEDDRPQVRENLVKDYAAPYLIRMFRKNGEYFDAEIEARNFQQKNDIWRVSAIRDISVQKQAEENQKKLQVQLTQAQKMESVGRLAGGVAHDFNNMLGVILGYTELAVNHAPPDTRLGEYLKQIHGAAKRSADMTQQLLAFARKQTIVPRVLDLNGTVAGMIKMLRRLIGEDIDLVWRPAPGHLPVKMDPSQIDQVMANLCVNARDAIAGVGRLTIETAPVIFDEAYCAERPEYSPGPYARLMVSDSGCGMDRETLDKLFEPFYTTKEIGAGTGLGLATVYGIVRQNEGGVEVESTPGVGTTFHVFLPLYRERANAAAERVALPQVKAGSETILLVEDEPMILEMTTMMLELHGYQVLAAATPKEAIRLADEYAGDIHLLITDVIMPEMNGRDLAGSLLASYPQLRCLFMSGYTASVIAHHGVLDEQVEFIQKPFSMTELCNRVRDVLDTRRDNEQESTPG